MSAGRCGDGCGAPGIGAEFGLIGAVQELKMVNNSVCNSCVFCLFV